MLSEAFDSRQRIETAIKGPLHLNAPARHVLIAFDQPMEQVFIEHLRRNSH
jgi:hypothetical protein